MSVSVCLGCMYICVSCVCLVSEDQRRASDPLDLELHVVVSHYVGAGNQTQVLCKSSPFPAKPSPLHLTPCGFSVPSHQDQCGV